MKSVPREQQEDQSAWNVNRNETATQERGCKIGGQGLIRRMLHIGLWVLNTLKVNREVGNGKHCRYFNRNLKHLEWGSRNMFRKKEIEKCL